MEQRRLGRTGHRSTVVTFGTAGIGKVDQETADLAIQLVLDHGVNHFDVAPRYGEAEVRLQPWMPRIRDRIFLGCKTGQLTRDAAAAELHRSSLLEMLYENQGLDVTRADLIKTIWGEEQAVVVSEQALYALVRRLRDRLASVDPVHVYIATIRGHGLRLDNPPITED